MHQKISRDRSKITFTLDQEEKNNIKSLRESEEDEVEISNAVEELLSNHFCNCELQWINPADTGDITEAPMLGILGETTTEDKGPYGAVHCGFWDEKARYNPITERWAYMNYQVEDPYLVLAEKGEITFSN